MKIQLKKYGTKKNAVLLFPGWTYPVENEALFLKELTKKYCCYTIHLPGYSDVPEVDQNYSFEDFAKKLHEILHSQQISPVAHIGFSMGCRMVMTYEQLYPTSVKKILVGCPFEMSIPAWGIFLLAHEGLLLGLTRTYGLQKAVVTKAYRAISDDPHANFSSANVTLKGAYYSLLALLKSKPTTTFDPNTFFLYGEKDPYMTDLPKDLRKQTHIIKDAVHNCIAGREKDVVGIITDLSDVKNLK